MLIHSVLTTNKNRKVGFYGKLQICVNSAWGGVLRYLRHNFLLLKSLWIFYNIIMLPRDMLKLTVIKQYVKAWKRIPAAPALLFVLFVFGAVFAFIAFQSGQQNAENNVDAQTPQVISAYTSQINEDESGEKQEPGDTRTASPTTSPSPRQTQSRATTTSPTAPSSGQLSQTFKITRAQFIGARVYCELGIQLATIDNMRVYATNVPQEGFTMTWQWESSMPSLHYDVDNLVRSITFPPGETAYLTLPETQAFPHLYRASEWDASSSSFNGVIPAHSVRIHILSPNDAYTEWFAIPEFSTTAHPCE